MIPDSFLKMPEKIDKAALTKYSNAMLEIHVSEFMFKCGYIDRKTAENDIKKAKQKLDQAYNGVNEATKCELIMIQIRFKNCLPKFF